MTEKIKICCDESFCLNGIIFKKKEFAALCDMEMKIPDGAYVAEAGEDIKIFAVKSEIGSEEHPFILMCEAARYIDGVWIVGIDEKQDKYFTPIFTNLD